MKLLFLNSIITVPNEKGKKRIELALENDEPKLDYDALGMKPPKEDISEDGYMNLMDGEFEYDYKDCTLRLSEFSHCVDCETLGTTVYLKSGEELWVEESAEQIYGYILVLTNSWFKNLIISIKNGFRSKD
jgi:hypothetical protein